MPATGSAFRRQHQGSTGAAAHVQQPGVRRHGGVVENRPPERPHQLFLHLGPVAAWTPQSSPCRAAVPARVPSTRHDHSSPVRFPPSTAPCAVGV